MTTSRKEQSVPSAPVGNPLSPSGQEPDADVIADRQRRVARARVRRSRISRWVAWLASLVVVLALWQILYGVTDSSGLVFTGPVATFERLWEVIRDGTLLGDFWVTSQEFLIASAFAVVVGIVIGVVVGYFRPVGIVLEPWLAAGYATPLIALTPLFILWFGIGIWSKIAIVFLVMVFPIIINTALGVSTADQNLIDVMRSMRASRAQIVRKVLIRGSVPHITAGLRLSVGKGFTAVVAAELLGSNAGMGYRLLVAAQTFDISLILAYVVVLAVIGAVLMLGMENLSQRFASRRS